MSALQVNIAEAACFQETLDNGGELCAGTADALFNIDAWAAQNLTEEIKVLIGKTDEQLVLTFRSSCAGACKGFAHRLIRQWLADFSIDGDRDEALAAVGKRRRSRGLSPPFSVPGPPLAAPRWPSFHGVSVARGGAEGGALGEPVQAGQAPGYS